MNWTAIKAIYVFEMARFFRTFLQSLISPVISTSLYFVVFGAAIGSRIDQGRWRELWCIYCAWFGNANGDDTVDFQRIFWVSISQNS